MHKPNYTKGAHEMGGRQQVLCRGCLMFNSKSFTLLTVGQPPASLSPVASIFLSTASLSAYSQTVIFPIFYKTFVCKMALVCQVDKIFFLTTLPLPATMFFFFAAKLGDWSVLTVPTPLLYSFPSITPLKSIHQSQR